MEPQPATAASSSARPTFGRVGAIVGGRYRLRAPIGRGAMGEVWAAEHLTLGTSVALKMVDTDGRADAAELLARFELEGRSVAQIKSPHVVAVLDHGADGTIAFMVMELLHGESLEQRLQRRGALTPSEVAHVIREVARGVERAHAAGIVHRDLKPPNVFIANVGGVEVVKVLDFGIAKMVGVQVDAHLQTQAGFVVGTPAYMSPEQILGNPVDHRSDLWQLALLAFECMTGKRAFDGPTLGKLFMSVCNSPLPVPSEHGPSSPGFDAWFARAASRDPAGRFQTAVSLAEALGAVLAPGGVGEAAVLTVARTMPRRAPTGGTGRTEAWSTPQEPVKRASPTALIAGFLLAPMLALGGGGAFLLFRAPPPKVSATSSPDATANPQPSWSSAPAPTSDTTASPSIVATSEAAAPAGSATPTASPSGAASAKSSPKPHPVKPGTPAHPSIDLGI